MTITVTPTAAGFAVKFPFALKDQFKRVFPSARWDGDGRAWIVGPRSKARLEQWVAAAGEAAQAADAAETAALTEAELAEVRAQLTTLRSEIESVRCGERALTRTRELLDAERAKLADAQAEAEEAKRARKAAFAGAKALLSGVIDIDAVIALARTMAANHKPADRQAKARFSEAQDACVVQRDRLRAAGFESRGLNFLVRANINRPDRDQVSSFNPGWLFDLHPYAPEEAEC